MTTEYNLTPKLKLILDHLSAVRTVNEYVNGVVGLNKDMQDLSNHLQQDINRSVLHFAGWKDLAASKGILYSSPESKWRVVRRDNEINQIRIEISVASPFDSVEPYVELTVPANWRKRQEFIDKLKPPPGFEHVSQYPLGELTESASIFKYVKYADYVGAKGVFNSAGFINAFREATRTLVALDKKIDRILEGLD